MKIISDSYKDIQTHSPLIGCIMALIQNKIYVTFRISYIEETYLEQLFHTYYLVSLSSVLELGAIPK